MCRHRKRVKDLCWKPIRSNAWRPVTNVIDESCSLIYRFSMISKYDLKPGDIVSVRFGGVLRHYGLVTFGGRILSNNGERGGVISQSLSDFAQGRELKHHPRNKPEESEYLAHHRAHRRLGHDYDLTSSNCVHFVRSARGKSPTATQYARGALATLGDMFGPKRDRW